MVDWCRNMVFIYILWPPQHLGLFCRENIYFEGLRSAGLGEPPERWREWHGPPQVRGWWQTSWGAPSRVDTAQLATNIPAASTQTPRCPAAYRCEHQNASGQTINCQSRICLIQSTLGLIPYLFPLR